MLTSPRNSNLITALLLFCSFSLSAQIQQLNLRPINNSDDAEQQLDDGSMSLTSSDLELGGYDGEDEQICGIRFPNVSIPQNATIISAYIQFNVNNEGAGNGAIIDIRAQIGDADTYTEEDEDISNRPYTGTVLEWNAPAWNIVDASGSDQRTPDISSLVTEAMQSNFNQGDALAFVFSVDSEQGEITADAVDSGGNISPELVIQYSLDGSTSGNTDTLPSGLVINEINYRSVDLLQNIDYIELYNGTDDAIDLSGWTIANAVNYTFPSGTSIEPTSYLVIAGNPSDLGSQLNFSNAIGPYTGTLSSDGEKIELRDQAFVLVDEVNYKSWDEWPSTRHLNGGRSPISIQKVNPALPGMLAGSWSSFSPTPGAVNDAVQISDINNIPVVQSINRSIKRPTSGQEMIIEATLTNIDDLSGNLSVELEYQIVNPGNYIHKADAAYNTNWTAIQMTDNGSGADTESSDGTYTAAIPANVQTNRRLIRYRINVTTSENYSNTYPDQRFIESNYSYYVYDGFPTVNGYDISQLSDMQDITVITGDDTADEFIGPGNGNNNDGQYLGDNYLGEGTLIYNGQVYDHIRFRPRGQENGRGQRLKPGIKFDMNRSNTFAPVKECGEEYPEKRGKLTLSGGYVSDITTHGFTESLVHKTLGLMGGMERKTEYTQLRIVDESGEADDFWGVFLVIEGYDKAYFKEHEEPDGNIWRHRSGRLSHQGDFPNSGNIGPWPENANLIDYNLTLKDKAANMFLGNGASNYEGKHSQRDYYNPETGLWHTFYGDYDSTFGAQSDDNSFNVRSNSQFNQNIQLVQSIAGQEDEFKNVMRSAYDLLFNDQQINYLIDVEAAKIRNSSAAYDWTDVDRSRWNQDYDLGNVDSHFNWYRDWFEDRADFLEGNDEFGFDDNNIPNKPSINLTGSQALDNLTFSNSNFSGSGDFERLEWRVGEWSDPSNPIYQNICEPKYEIESVWESGAINNFSNNFTIPAAAKLKVGRTYKIRVRYQNDDDIWSNWSDAVQIIAQPANNSTTPDLVINEIMYKPSDDCGVEFIEILNTESTTVSLNQVAFTSGITYEFPNGATIASGAYIVLAKDSDTFQQKYGFAPYGEYSGSLSNDGELLELRGQFDKVIDQLTYSNVAPWDDKADGEGNSLELEDSNLSNEDAANWCHSDTDCGTPGSANNPDCDTEADNQAFLDYGINITGVGYNITNEIGESDDDLEFLYITNFGTEDRVVAGDSIFQGITFAFPAGATIAAGETVMLVKDPSRYPDVNLTMYTWDDGKLSNGGEGISYKNTAGDIINAFTYDDVLPWPVEADGAGSYLQLKGDNLDNTIAGNWEAMAVPEALGFDCPAAGANIGDNCDDNDPTTTNDEYDANCQCVGLPLINESLNITGINYNPQVDASLDGDNFEFLLVTNYGNTDVTVAGDSIKGMGYTFPAGEVIAAGETVMLTKGLGNYPDLGFRRLFWEDGKLSNGGEQLLFKKPNNGVVNDLEYDDKTPWPEEADGGGFYLRLISPELDNTIATNWEAIMLPSPEPVFDCPTLSANVGDSCNDGDANTANDTVDANCDCVGTPIFDCPALSANIGDSCNDGDANTANDTVDANCDCVGTPIFDCPALAANIGDSCNDGDANTANDTVDANCDCVGTPIFDCPTLSANVGDSCNDGDANTANDTVDANCDCVGTPIFDCPALSANIGDSCNDGDANTANDTVDANCDCVGTPIFDCPALSANIGDSCNDGDANTANDTVDANCDCVGTPIFDCPALSANIGDSCNDGDANTANDTVNANCDCVGTSIFDCPALSANIGDSCNDGDANTANDTVDANCDCVGTPIFDCPALSANIGDSCNDGDANTANDTVDANCDCVGTPIFDCPALSANIGDSCNDGDANTANDTVDANCDCVGTPIFDCPALSANIGDSCNDGDANTANDTVDANCDCVGTPIFDCPALSANIGDSCNDGDANTANDTVDANCDCVGTPIFDCPTLSANIGDSCNDGDANTANDTVDANCDCVGTPVVMEECVFVQVDFNDFEDGYGIWNDPGTDCSLKESPIDSESIRLRDNNSTSFTNTDVLDFTDITEAQIDFTYTAESMERDEDFFLEYSLDGGNTYIVAGNWVNRIDFVDDDTNMETVNIVADFTATTVFRFRCDASSNYDKIYLDDIRISSCQVTTPVFDCPAIAANIGDACDDADDTTENDAVQTDCSCAGTPIITFDCPQLNANIGDACDDADDTTENDAVQTDCSCAGTPIITFDCPQLNANIGDACDDADDTTENDAVQTDCSCAGTPVITFDCPQLNANIGDACDDADDTTENDAVQTDCSCAGTPIITFDCPQLNANVGDACDDADDTTENDAVQTDCSCAGTPIITFDCPQLNANIGDACDDSDDTTENDAVQTDCSCAGTPIITFDCPLLNANIGDACDDADDTTENDAVQTDCSCAGTPIEVGECVITEYNTEDFESDFGIWIDGGGDCNRTNGGANSSDFNLRLRDNDGASSSIYTDETDFSSINEIELQFMLRFQSMEPNERLVLEYSLNGGDDFVIAEEWISGVNFNDGEDFAAQTVNIMDDFTSNTVIRLRCDASTNYDQVYIDDLKISTCNFQSNQAMVANARVAKSTFNLGASQKSNAVQLSISHDLTKEAIYLNVNKLDTETGSFEAIEDIIVDQLSSAYTVIDTQVEDGDNVYRATVFYADGTQEDSALRVVKFNANNLYKIFPNPTSDYLNVDLSEYIGRNVEVSLYDITGTAIIIQTYDNLSQSEISFDLTNSAPGSYVIRVNSDDRRPITKQFVVIKH